MDKIKDKQNSTHLDEDRHLPLEHIGSTYSQFEDKLAELSILRELGIALLYIGIVNLI